VMVINVGRTPNDRRMIDALAFTIQTVFPSVYVTDIPNSFNTMIFATRQPTRPENLAQNQAALLALNPPCHPLLTDTLAVTLANLQPTPTQGTLFTDDKASVEWLTNSMVIDFFLSGSLEETLQ